jgi:hypothetical protein
MRLPLIISRFFIAAFGALPSAFHAWKAAPIMLTAALAVRAFTPALAAEAAPTFLGYGQLTVAAADVLEAGSEPEADPVAGPKEPPTVDEILLDVCADRGYGEECAKTLLGMLWKESLNNAKAIGDGGRARGYFQIHYRLHKISVECAEDLRCSADWTISYLERNGYPRYVTYAVQCHNGCNARNGYAASALRHGNRLWGTGLRLAAATP